MQALGCGLVSMIQLRPPDTQCQPSNRVLYQYVLQYLTIVIRHKMHSQQNFLDPQIINSGLFQLPPSRPSLVVFEDQKCRICLEVDLNINMQEVKMISGSIRIEAMVQMPNRDFIVELKGRCVRYSCKPSRLVNETDRQNILPEATSDFLDEMLHHEESGIATSNDLGMSSDAFLEGMQKLRYVGDNQKDNIDTLQVGVYFLPFQFDVPPKCPPSVGMIGFIDMFFSVQYKIIIRGILSQTILLKKRVTPPQIFQVTCTTLQFSLRKYCLVCLGNFQVQATVNLNQDILRVEVIFFQIAKTNTNPFITEIVVDLMVEIVDVGAHKLASHNLTLSPLSLGRQGGQFTLCKLNNFKIRSYDNQIFKIRFYLVVKLKTSRWISIHSTHQKKLYLHI